MMAYLALGLLGLTLLYLLGRSFVALPARHLAHALKTFGAAFAGLAGTGLLFTGRVGLALVTFGAAAMAIRALWRGPRGADPMQGGSTTGSSVETELLAMRLDHATGEVDGRVKRGRAAGRDLSSLGLTALLDLLDEANRDDPPSLPLLEAYLDRRFPDWREQRTDTAPAAAPAAMDERTALEILGLSAGADEAAIRTAHRELMSRVHPDHGGSSYLAAQLNQARDFLLRRR